MTSRSYEINISCRRGRPSANWTNCSKLDPSTTVGCSRTHNNTLHVLQRTTIGPRTS